MSDVENFSNDEWDQQIMSIADQEYKGINTSSDKDENGPEPEHINVLLKCFGHTQFRPMQWKIIRSIIIEQRDICAIMATGYGKSLCYQYPSVFSGGLTIVISPLISLMEDQVLSLKVSNIPACLLGSAQTKQHQVISDILARKYTIVYATPEFCLGETGMDVMRNIYENVKVDLLAIDEAHCVSQWGHDFRTKYRHIWKLRNVLKHVPVLAVTATATEDVQNDIVKSLKLQNPHIICSGFDRPNLYFEVVQRRTCEPFDNIKHYMIRDKDGVHFSGSTIIYCITKKQTEEVSQNLKLHNIKCSIYHAALPMSERKKAHEMFAKDQIKVIVATIAFGMGIDKPDVRMVIHYGASKDLESYYQEVGRAGRDGLPAKCILFYRSADFFIHENLREYGNSGSKSESQKEHKEKMSQFMQKYVDTLDCRRFFILNYFRETISLDKDPTKNCCDNCSMQLVSGPKYYQKYEGLDDKGQYNLADDAKLFLQVVQLMKGKFGNVTYILMLRGSKSAKLYGNYQSHELHGKGKHRSDEWWKIIARLLEREGYLKKVRQKKNPKATFSYSTVDLSEEGIKLLWKLMENPKTEVRIVPSKELMKLLNVKKSPLSSQSRNWTESDKPSSSTASHTNEKFHQFKRREDEKRIEEDQEDPLHKKYRMDLYKQLIAKRADIAFHKECMPYMVGSNTALMQMSKLRPNTIAELKSHAIDGFTESKIDSFGKIYTDFIADYCKEYPPPDSVCPSKANTVDKPLSMCTLKESSKRNIENISSVNSKQTLKQFAFKEKDVKILNANSKPDIHETGNSIGNKTVVDKTVIDECSDFKKYLMEKMDFSEDELEKWGNEEDSTFSAIENKQDVTMTMKTSFNHDQNNKESLHTTSETKEGEHQSHFLSGQGCSNVAKRQRLVEDNFDFENDSSDAFLLETVESIEKKDVEQAKRTLVEEKKCVEIKEEKKKFIGFGNKRTAKKKPSYLN